MSAEPFDKRQNDVSTERPVAARNKAMTLYQRAKYEVSWWPTHIKEFLDHQISGLDHQNRIHRTTADQTKRRFRRATIVTIGTAACFGVYSAGLAIGAFVAEDLLERTGNRIPDWYRAMPGCYQSIVGKLKNFKKSFRQLKP